MADVPLELSAIDAEIVLNFESAPTKNDDGRWEVSGLLRTYEIATVLDGAENDAIEFTVDPGETVQVSLVCQAS